MGQHKPLFSRRIGRFKWDRLALLVLLLIAAMVASRAWLAEHPQHDPWAPLDLRDPQGWATARKLQAIKGDTAECRAVLSRSAVIYSALPAAGDGQCLRPDRTRLDDYPFASEPPPTTCGVAVALELWRMNTLEPQAREIFEQGVQRIEHLGAYSCRRLYGRDEGAWSEHATGNAVDIAGFILDDGTRINVLRDWNADDPDKVLFLRRVRDGACRAFATTLSPDYNATHRDHFHLDMAGRWSGVCR